MWCVEWKCNNEKLYLDAVWKYLSFFFPVTLEGKKRGEHCFLNRNDALRVTAALAAVADEVVLKFKDPLVGEVVYKIPPFSIPNAAEEIDIRVYDTAVYFYYRIDSLIYPLVLSFSPSPKWEEGEPLYGRADALPQTVKICGRWV